MNLKLFMLSLCCGMLNYCIAQSELKEGAKITEVIGNAWGDKNMAVDLKQLEKKLIIIDFWGFGCSACVESFPKLDSLQRKYNSDIQIILVNKEPIVATKKFFQEHRRIRKPNVLFISGDTLLHHLFPHIYIPHVVMIDSNNTVLHITGGQNLTDRTIATLLAHKKMDLRTKFELKDYDKTKPPIAEGNGRWFNKIKYYSYLMAYTPELTSLSTGTIIKDSVDGSLEMQCNNRTIGDFFAWIATKGKNRNKFAHKYSVAYEVKDTTKFVLPSDTNKWDSWEAENIYLYNLKVPAKDSGRLFEMMETDITRYFPYWYKVERRIVPTLVLSLDNDSIRLTTSGGKRTERITYDVNNICSMKLVNYPVNNLKYVIGNLNVFIGASCPYPFLSTIDSQFNVDIETSFDCNSLESVQNALRALGIKLEIKNVEMDVLVIKDK